MKLSLPRWHLIFLNAPVMQGHPAVSWGRRRDHPQRRDNQACLHLNEEIDVSCYGSPENRWSRDRV